MLAKKSFVLNFAKFSAFEIVNWDIINDFVLFKLGVENENNPVN